jgi:hypothetical protein
LLFSSSQIHIILLFSGNNSTCSIWTREWIAWWVWQNSLWETSRTTLSVHFVESWLLW